MRRSNPSLTSALCISLTAHGLALCGLAWSYIEHNLDLRSPPIDRYAIMVERMNQEQPVPPPPPPKKKPPAPPKKEEFEKPKEEMKDDSGEHKGVGTANRSTDGAKPMQAEAGLEQADLMKDAQDIADEAFLPASAGKPNGSESQQQKSPRSGKQIADANKDAVNETKQPKAATAVPTLGVGPNPKPVTPVATSQKPSGILNPVANATVSKAATLKQDQKEIRGHRATASDSESVAFAKGNIGTFHAGRLEARQGLKVKTTIPRFSDSSWVDYQNLGEAHTIIGARVDDDGNVQEVSVIQSSGSDNIDEDRKLAVINSWTLEPKKDSDGHVISYLWMISFE